MVSRVGDTSPDREPLLRVVFEVKSLDRGGLETVVASLARGSRAQGISPLVVCTQGGGQIASELVAEGLHVEVLSADDRPQEMRDILRRFRVDLLNCHFSTFGVVPAAELGIPVVVTIHNAYAWLGAGIYEEFRSLDRFVDRYVAVSEFVADFSCRRFRIERDRVAIVRNGITASVHPAGDTERAAARGRLGIDPTRPFLAQLGRIERLKCQLATIDAVSRLRVRQPNLLCWLAGGLSEQDYAGLVRARIENEGLEHHVILAGERQDIADILCAADVIVQPSILEGLSLAAIETLLAGVPLVSSDVGDARFLVGEPHDGVRAGRIVRQPTLDPVSCSWSSLLELAGDEHPPHAPELADAVAEILETLPSYRRAARARAVELRALLSADRMCAAFASVATQSVVGTSRTIRAEWEGLRAELAESRETVRQLARTAETIQGDLNRALEVSVSTSSVVTRLAEQSDRTEAELSRLRHTSEQTLEKLRLTRRFKAGVARVLGRRPRSASVDANRLPTASDLVMGSESVRIEPGPRQSQWLVVGVVPMDDIGGGQRSAQIARVLARSGQRVAYAARFARSESRDLGLTTSASGIEVLAWDVSSLIAWAKRCQDRLRVVLELPEDQVVELALAIKPLGACIVYDKIDNWNASAWAPWFRAECEQQLVENAHHVIASARVLVTQLEHLGAVDTTYLPNAVDRSLFHVRSATDITSAPTDVVRGERTLVYAGSLWGDWFDWQAVETIARARPSWSILLIGDPPDPPPTTPPANVHFLGLKPQTSLPAYYAAADACLIPFKPSPVVDAVSPLKLFEYLAMHRPVVASAMPELRGLPHVFVADAPEAWVGALESAFVAPAPDEQIERFLADNSWEVRVRALEALTACPSASVVVLCYNNEGVIGTCVESLVRHRGEEGYEIVVVDNGSSDRSLEILKSFERAGTIRLLRNPINGCSSGRNLGIRAARGELIVFLDSDQWATEDGWLRPALEILNDHREIGAVGWNAGWFRDGSGGGPIVDDLPKRGMTGAFATARFRSDVAYLATSGLVVPRSVLARTNGFDEFYDPTCFEDTDLSFQVKAAGYDLAYCPRMKLAHRPHATTGVLGGYSEVYLRNERYFLDKWRTRRDLFLSLPQSPSAAGE